MVVWSTHILQVNYHDDYNDYNDCNEYIFSVIFITQLLLHVYCYFNKSNIADPQFFLFQKLTK